MIAIKFVFQQVLSQLLHSPTNGSCHLMDKNKKLFPQRLWELIHDPKYNFCLRWSADGQQVYLNRNDFESHYLKTPNNQFHTQKAISFVRQMNMYGFRKVDDCYYENDNFKRNCPHLLKNMVRRHSNKNFFSNSSSLISNDSSNNNNQNISHQRSAQFANNLLDQRTLTNHSLCKSEPPSTIIDHNQQSENPIDLVNRRPCLTSVVGPSVGTAQSLVESSTNNDDIHNQLGAALVVAAINSANPSAPCSPLVSSLYLKLAAMSFVNYYNNNDNKR